MQSIVCTDVMVRLGFFSEATQCKALPAMGEVWMSLNP